MSMKPEKSRATSRGNRAYHPTAAKLGWITKSVPVKPTIQADRRAAPTVSLSKTRPRKRLRNGSTKTMAMASANGMWRSAVNIRPIPAM
jgi:hypothetical protein